MVAKFGCINPWLITSFFPEFTLFDFSMLLIYHANVLENIFYLLWIIKFNKKVLNNWVLSYPTISLLFPLSTLDEFHSTVIQKVCLSAEGAENISWPWLSLLRGWGSLTMTFTGKFVFVHIYATRVRPQPWKLLILLRLFRLKVA